MEQVSVQKKKEEKKKASVTLLDWQLWMEYERIWSCELFPQQQVEQY